MHNIVLPDNTYRKPRLLQAKAVGSIIALSCGCGLRKSRHAHNSARQGIITYPPPLRTS